MLKSIGGFFMTRDIKVNFFIGRKGKGEKREEVKYNCICYVSWNWLSYKFKYFEGSKETERR